MKQTLQQKQDEKGRLLKAYRAKQRAKWADLCEREPRLPAFQCAVRRMTDPRALFVWLADSWVRHAPDDIKIAALRIVDKHANRQAVNAGGFELDDPLPPERNLYLAAREMLAVR